jgi:hypothetical protein
MFDPDLEYMGETSSEAVSRNTDIIAAQTFKLATVSGRNGIG